MRRVPLLLTTWLLAVPAAAQYQDWEEAEDTSGPGFDPGEMPASPEETPPVEEEAPAEEEAPDEEVPALAGTFLVWGEVAAFAGTYDIGGETATSQVDGFALSPLVGGAYYVTDTIRAGAVLPMALLFHSEVTGPVTMEEGGAAVRFGNAVLEAQLVGRSGSLRHRLGLGVALPLATANDAAELGALQLASAMRGGWDIWTWVPERLSVIGTGSVETDLGEGLVVAGDADVAVLFHAGDGDGETLFAAQVAGNVEYLLGTVALGARLTGVFADDALPDRKSFQLAVMPYARMGIGEEAFVSAGFVLNVMAPYGFSFAEGKAWGLRVGAGTAF